MKYFCFVILIFSQILKDCNQTVSYNPPFLPAKLVFREDGNISIVGDLSVLTPLGEFSIGAEYSLRKDDNSTLIILRDQKKGKKGFDTIYRLYSDDDFVAVIDGRTSIHVFDRQVLIDITSAHIQSIEFKRVEKTITEPPTQFFKPFPLCYQPFALSAWAYDDSTVSKWYGLGFLLFVVRLFIAIVLLIFDLIITIALGIGVLIDSTLGTTVRNIYYGLLSIVLLIILVLIKAFLSSGSKK